MPCLRAGCALHISVYKKSCHEIMTAYRSAGLSSLNFAGLKAMRTNMHSFGSAVYHAFHSLNVGLPNPVRSSMRMAYVVTKMNALATNITLSHRCTS